MRRILHVSALAAFVAVASVAACRADDSNDAFALLRQAFREQTNGELAAHHNVLRAWSAFEQLGLAKTTDEPPKGAIVFYHTPYSAHGGRLAVTNGDATA